jgi:hypothetical protein
MIRIAAIIVLMASPAWATDTWTDIKPDGTSSPQPLVFIGCATTDGKTWMSTDGRPCPVNPNGQATVNNNLPVTIGVPQTCDPGWTLVDVVAKDRPTVHKCAPVGDLRDPH